jgi:dTDP-4-dehydrorhamnose reductase
MIRPESKVLITGCGGMLGEAVYATFSPKCTVRATDIDLNEPWLTKLDVRDKAAVTALCEEFKPDYIVHLAALTDMEQCEREFENSYRTNTEAVQFVAHEAQMRGIPLVYISTAGIFDGAKDIYDEDDAPNPLSIYGRTKYLGELIAKTVPQHIVVRAGWMMGGGPKKDKKFIGKLFKQIRDGKKEFYAVTDKMGSPCYTWDLARSLFFWLGGDGEMEVKYHTATHMLHQALREVLGETVEQRGSNITPERLRFDFAFERKMTDEEKRQVEGIINTRIKEALPVIREEVSMEEARARGAIGLFGDKYGDVVSIYRIGEGTKRGSGTLGAMAGVRMEWPFSTNPTAPRTTPFRP